MRGLRQSSGVQCVELLKYAEAFKLAKKVSGLELNVKKCVLVPTAASSWSLELAHGLRSHPWLVTLGSAWGQLRRCTLGTGRC